MAVIRRDLGDVTCHLHILSFIVLAFISNSCYLDNNYSFFWTNKIGQQNKNNNYVNNQSLICGSNWTAQNMVLARKYNIILLAAHLTLGAYDVTRSYLVDWCN